MITEQEVVSVAPAAWAETCASFAARGLAVVDWLTAIDRESELDVLDVVVCLVNPGSGGCVIVTCRVDANAPRVDSLASMFRSAEWHERETAEMFGIEFTGRELTEPLLLRSADRTPLRKSSPLEARVETPWPGADPDSGRRRRKLPPGVRVEWVPDDQ
jgi:NADH-quinone oxidoreductase subunit C